MKRLIFLLTLVLAMGVIPSAHAEEITIDGYVTINYPATVKLNQTGCQNIAFKYVTDENLPRENSVFLVSITPNDSKRVYGYAAWMSTLTYMGDQALPPMARIGVLQVKICRKAFMYSSKSTKLTLASKPGTYTIYFNAGTYDENGSLTGEKIEFKRKIKFY
ncbi:MAG: hypothetical protein F2906_07135 [Actinobacteria bacterium]|nr:hypothetical protein [Actinomycetota bacterium]MSW13819.1 hypothetical protein [Actinomycetota bacterium]MTA55137.1 hypothetical protein [Actinomycetota bacterium]